MKYSIGIVGIGYVGGAILPYFKKMGALLFLYDKYKKIGSLEEISKADVIFLCLPTPFDEKEGYLDASLWETMRSIKGEKNIVIKSTVLPGTTEEIQKSYPRHRILFNPEFLRAKTAKKDFITPERQIIGYTSKSKSIARRILRLLPKAPYETIMPASEAELVKYACNAFLALRVIFANQLYDLSKKLNLDYAAIIKAVGRDSRIGESHFDVFHEGYRGYGGNCLPKDVRALLQFAAKKKVPLKLLQVMEEINNHLLGQNRQRA